MTDKELLAFAKRVKRILDRAWENDGDTFGMLHNDATDLDCELSEMIEKLSKK